MHRKNQVGPELLLPENQVGPELLLRRYGELRRSFAGLQAARGLHLGIERRDRRIVMTEAEHERDPRRAAEQRDPAHAGVTLVLELHLEEVRALLVDDRDVRACLLERRADECREV